MPDGAQDAATVLAFMQCAKALTEPPPTVADLSIALAMLAVSYDRPSLRLPALRFLAEMFLPTVTGGGSRDGLTPDEFECWQRLQLVEVQIPVDRAPDGVERRLIHDILRQHRDSLSRLAA